MTGAVERQIGWGTIPAGGDPDPLGERECSPVPGVVQRYPDRALVLATRTCFVECAFCTRLEFVKGGSALEVDTDGAIAYLGGQPGIREVLVSGGDPLTLGDAALLELLGRIRAIPHVGIIRIGTRAPMARPGRVTEELCEALSGLGPVMAVVHFNHPEELTLEALGALTRIADAGIPLLNQAVLLRGVNDDPDVLEALCSGLARARARPYYLLSCDRVAGTERFWVGLDRAIQIAKALEARLPGHAVPALVVDLPGWEGKARIAPSSPPRRVEGGYVVRGRSGREIIVPG